jgi:hypothetical protein
LTDERRRSARPAHNLRASKLQGMGTIPFRGLRRRRIFDNPGASISQRLMMPVVVVE